MKPFALLALLCLMAVPVWASHLLGGQIQAKNSGGNTYEVTVVLYMSGGPAAEQMSSIPVCLGDGTTLTISRQTRLLIDPTISINIYRFTHTYNGPGVFRITTSLANRTTMVNLSQGNDSVFSLSTTIQATGNLRNATPVYEPSPTLWQVGINQRSTLSLRATDADGDSLSYALVKPLTSSSLDACNAPFAISRYVFPNDVSKIGTYKLNSRSGELVWDAPSSVGQYTTTLLIREWRNGVQIGESYVETVIRVQDKGGFTTPIPPYEPAAEFPALITGLETNAESGLVLTISPNPVQTQLVARLRSAKATTAHIQLVDLSGRIVAEKALTRPSTDHDYTLPVENLPSGLYILKADVNGRVVSQKVIKQ